MADFNSITVTSPYTFPARITELNGRTTTLNMTTRTTADYHRNTNDFCLQ